MIQSVSLLFCNYLKLIPCKILTIKITNEDHEIYLTKMIVLKKIFPFLIAIIFFGLPVFAQQQVMVTPDTYVEDQTGNEITYEVFVEKMNTGQFFPLSLKDENGEHIGFQLSPKNESPSDIPSQKLGLQSSKIDGAVSLNFIYRDHLFAQIEFYNGRTWTTKWMVYDTGTFIPVILLPEVAAKIGTVQKIRIGDIEVNEPPMGSFGSNDLLRNLKRYKDQFPDEFGEFEVAGIVGLPVFSNYLTSIHANTGKITLRPIDSEQRTLNADDPIARVPYRSDQGNIWFPVTVNGRDGYAHLDTGNPYFDVDSDVEFHDDDHIEYLMIGGTDLADYFNEMEFRSEDMEPRYQGVEIDVISAFGNRAAGPFIITIDPRDKMLYFEELIKRKGS